MAADDTPRDAHVKRHWRACRAQRQRHREHEEIDQPAALKRVGR
jgi:hypothetical protein